MYSSPHDDANTISMGIEILIFHAYGILLTNSYELSIFFIKAYPRNQFCDMGPSNPIILTWDKKCSSLG